MAEKKRILVADLVLLALVVGILGYQYISGYQSTGDPLFFLRFLEGDPSFTAEVIEVRDNGGIYVRGLDIESNAQGTRGNKYKFSKRPEIEVIKNGNLCDIDEIRKNDVIVITFSGLVMYDELQESIGVLHKISKIEIVLDINS